MMSGAVRARQAAILWVAAAVISLASVLIVNGGALFYFDTIGYVSQGREALAQLGFEEPAVAPAADDTQAGGEGQAAPKLRTVDGSRSAFYSFLAGVLSRAGLLEGLILFNTGALFLCLWLIARAALRGAGGGPSVAALVSAPLIVASLGSLPFYVAYLMPDLFAPVLILAVAGVTAFGRDMRAWELALIYLVGAVAVVSHLSHFAIAGLLFLATVVVSPLISRRRWWLGPGVALAILAAAYAQQSAFRVVVAKAAHSEVVIRPFLTARLIQDGPGLEYLNDHCPDAAIPTCALHEALGWSDDPYRLTASHIIFETSDRLGSFRLMTPEDQKAVADAQRSFFLAVLADRPAATVLAFLKNTLIQTGLISIDMTLQSDNVVKRNAEVAGSLGGPLSHGRLTADQGWVGGIVALQGTVYLVALGLVVGFLLARGRVPWAVKGFAVMVLLGILANAFVCGAISQPATRYGARVIWLLPFLAAFMALFAPRRVAR